MRLSIIGISEQLYFDTDDIALVNIHNKTFYCHVLEFMKYNFDEGDNDIVIFDDDKVRIKPKNILYIPDLLEFEIDNNKVIKAIIKRYMSYISMDNEFKLKQNQLYMQLIQPFLDELNMIDVDYEYRGELEQDFFKKIPCVRYDFGIDDSIEEKLISIVKLYTELFEIKCVIINKALPLLNNEEISKVKQYISYLKVPIIFLDYLEESEVVIAPNLMIDEEYGVYTINLA